MTVRPPNHQGESAKEQWTDNHIKFIAENENNPESLNIYADGSITKKEGRHLTGYSVVGYYLGEVAFSTKGALGEQAEVFDAEMAGLSAVGKATKQFILNREWAQQPTCIVHQETWRVLLELREQGEEHELGRF